MQRKRWTLPVLLGLITAVLLVAVLWPKETPKRTVVVAARDLGAGTALVASDLTTTILDASQAPADAVADPAKLAGQTLAVVRFTGEPVTPRHLGPAVTLAPDERGIAISVKADTGLAGLLRPGMKVGVVATLAATAEAGREVYAKTTLEGLRVLYVSPDFQARPYTPATASATVTKSSSGGALGTDSTPATSSTGSSGTVREGVLVLAAGTQAQPIRYETTLPLTQTVSAAPVLPKRSSWPQRRRRRGRPRRRPSPPRPASRSRSRRCAGWCPWSCWPRSTRRATASPWSCCPRRRRPTSPPAWRWPTCGRWRPKRSRADDRQPLECANSIARAAGQPAVETTTVPPVRLLIVAQPGRSQAYYAAFVADARYAVQAVATSAADAKAKLALDPEAVVAEVVVCDGPAEFADIFAAYRGACFALVPAGLNQADADAVRGVRSVQALVEGEPNFADPGRRDPRGRGRPPPGVCRRGRTVSWAAATPMRP